MCSNMTSQRCKTCDCSNYCSKACQKADWPVHKLLCRDFHKFSTPPDASSRLGIFFPDNMKTPSFLWVSCPLQPAEDGECAWEKPNYHDCLGPGSIRSLQMTGNVLRSRALQDKIHVYSREGYLVDGSKINTSIVEVTKSLMTHSWSGPFLAMKLPGLDIDPGRYINIDMVGFRDVVDLFCTYPVMDINDMKAEGALAGAKDEFSGVRINCRGDQTIGGRSKFEAIQLPRNHPVFKAPVVGISKLIGLPVRVIRCPRTSDHNLNTFDKSNQAATFLHLSVDPNDRWGWAPMAWQEPAGSVIVVREDRTALAPEHVEALSYFCQYVLQPLFEDSMGSGMHPESPIKKTVVLQRMTPRSFENFYVGYNNWKRDNDPKWDRRCPWPYPF